MASFKRETSLISVICQGEEKLWFLWFIQEEDGWGQETGGRRSHKSCFWSLSSLQFKGLSIPRPHSWGIMFWVLKTCREDRPCTVQDFLGCTWQKVTHIHLSNKKHLLAHKTRKSKRQLVSLIVSLRHVDGVAGLSPCPLLDTIGLSHKGSCCWFPDIVFQGHPWTIVPHLALLDIT